jgi:hypothetical protein
MRSTQNTRLAPIQKKQENVTLQSEVDALIQSLQIRENKRNKKRSTRNDRVHWITRGRQQALRQVSTRLLAIEAASVTSYALYLALREYLTCLEKCCVDVQEERSAARPRKGLPIEQWKAEGEAQELPRIVRVLSQIVQAHMPDSIHHTLSLDGKHLIPLHHGSDEPFLKREISFSSQLPEMIDWSQMSVTGELALADSENHQNSASSPIRRGTSIPALGPFPIVPDEVPKGQQVLLHHLEDALSRHTRVLVNTEYEAGDTMSLLMIFLDRVLQYTSVEHILVLAGSVQLRAHLRQRYRTWVSLEDGVPLSEHYMAQDKPTFPPAPDTRICFSSIREMQLLTHTINEQDTTLCRQIYDLIIVYNLASLTAPWQQVLAYFDAHYSVGFGSPSDPMVVRLFDHNVITSEADCQVYREVVMRDI